MPEIESEPARALLMPLNRAQHLLFQLRAHARQLAQLLLAADAFQIVDAGNLIMLIQQRDALGTQALNFQQLQRRRRKTRQKLIARGERSARADVLQHGSNSLSDAGNFGRLALGIANDIGDFFGIRFNRGGGVAVAANAEAIFPGDLHQVRRLAQEPRNLTILHARCRL